MERASGRGGDFAFTGRRAHHTIPPDDGTAALLSRRPPEPAWDTHHKNQIIKNEPLVAACQREVVFGYYDLLVVSALVTA